MFAACFESLVVGFEFDVVPHSYHGRHKECTPVDPVPCFGDLDSASNRASRFPDNRIKSCQGDDLPLIGVRITDEQMQQYQCCKLLDARDGSNGIKLL